MSSRLAALRRSLDLMPSPIADRPGLLLRDPFGYTSQVLVIPPPLVPLLRYEQWNIDPASVVSFAALAFGRDALTPAGEGGA